ncbi:tRNA (5-methylaminomethyl-2-thiouridylate)-methyltransferase [Pedobacter sp. PACM 27299]|uniref:tRNA (5-methylaminomethyl-2-thiouridine)(34)-methyltransferase MnmD n=1 Tax=Pedobacter sp. PACM 27299 TaxID=1727164 RepID=UPI000706D604|nr:tRNA (5-methylaminomethyl-2-thiouridine)(34)-methyltransferase MnmD [Pedobacter sp. PACM 27299]ALL08923.1 tRNA (5-methylaminomethyl-2-thiouridylate)-methyltransferase [Pedobacter sp. PACM 27299]
MNIITLTADGSNTLFNETIGEHYHSKHGALQESKHVFIDTGLKHVADNQREISILEIGFGTGLNFLLTLEYAAANNLELKYTGLEAFPLELEALKSTGYQQYVPENIWNSLENNYLNALTTPVILLPGQELTIPHITLDQFQSPATFDLVYYDAFSVQHQPEMWSDEIIAHTCSFLKPGGTFVTYAITGKLKRALKSNGFTIEKLPGAPGKREMLRGTKL